MQGWQWYTGGFTLFYLFRINSAQPKNDGWNFMVQTQETKILASHGRSNFNHIRLAQRARKNFYQTFGELRIVVSSSSRDFRFAELDDWSPIVGNTCC